MVAQILHQFAPAPLAEVLEGRPRRLAVAFLRLYREEEDNFAIPRSENLTLLPFEAPYDSFCITEKEKKRFYRILRALRLDVSVHPVLSIMPISSPRARRNCELLHGLGAAERRAVIETLVKGEILSFQDLHVLTGIGPLRMGRLGVAEDVQSYPGSLYHQALGRIGFRVLKASKLLYRRCYTSVDLFT